MIASVQKAPRLTQDNAARIASELYGIEGSATPLSSDRDQNFLILEPDREGGCNIDQFILKIANSEESLEFLELQNQMIGFLRAGQIDLEFPRIECWQRQARMFPSLKMTMAGSTSFAYSAGLTANALPKCSRMGRSCLLLLAAHLAQMDAAAEIVELMKERGVLLSTDGPSHNVIKIKPPIIFQRRTRTFVL